MRIKVISIVLLVLFSSLTFSQRSSERKFKQSNSIETSKKKLHPFQSLLIQDDFNIYDSVDKAIGLDFLNSILYYNTIQLTDEIEYIFNESKKISKEDTGFYLESLRNKSLLSYQNYNFPQAIQEFRTYFKMYQAYYHTDTSYAFEYSKYCFAIQKTKPIEQFYILTDSALQMANKKIIPYNDLARTYISIGNYYKFGRMLDTARYLLNKSKYNIEKAPVQDFNLKSKLSVSFGELELLNGNNDLSILHFTNALESLLRTKHTNLQIARIYKSTATAMFYNNRIVDAINQYKMALFIFEDELPPNYPTTIDVYRYLGLANLRIGEDSIAISYLTKAVNLNTSPNKFFSYRNLAQAYSNAGNIKKADSVFQLSLEYTIQSRGPLSYQASATYHSFGQFILEKMHNNPKGEAYLGKCIQLRYNIYKEKNFDIGEPLNILGAHYINTGRIDEGLDSLQSALIIAIDDFYSKDIYRNPDRNKFVRQFIFHNTLAWKAYGLYLKYLQTNDIKDLEMSFETYDHFIYLAKEIRKYYKDTENIINAAELEYVFGQAVDIGRQLYEKTNNPIYIAKVFEFIEGKKSFTLMNSLSILEKKKLLKVPKELLEKESGLKSQLGKLNEKIRIEKKFSNITDTIIKYEKEVFNISQSLDSIQTTYKNEYSGFYNLKYGFKELTLNEIEKKIPSEQAFLNYAVSDSLLTLLCITHEGSTMFNHVIDSTFFNHIQGAVNLLKKVNTDDSYTEFHHFIKDSRILYKYLIEPITSLIAGKDLIIIPDDALSYISFDALLTHDVEIDRPDYSKLPYLIKQHKTNVANSMQIYFNMKSRSRTTDNSVYAFAPSYQDAKDTTGLPTEYQYLRPLDYANLEVKSIAKYFSTKLFIGHDATEDTFSNIATHASIIHLAMHTIIDDEKPMYSKLLFAYNKEDESGMVNTYELLTMNLNAELAVLSGCSTGDGELQKGEGVMSLSSGFQYAGVPAIVMSLWEVNDRFGALVIEKFYKYLAKGLPKNQALHRAKLEVLIQGNALYAHPFYWAGLTLMGEDSKTQLQSKFSTTYIFLILFLLTLFTFLLLKFRKRVV